MLLVGDCIPAMVHGMPHWYGNIENKVLPARDDSFHAVELVTRFLTLNFSEVEIHLENVILKKTSIFIE